MSKAFLRENKAVKLLGNHLGFWFQSNPKHSIIVISNIILVEEKILA